MLAKLEDYINYKFKNKAILQRAVTHSSYRAEHNLKYDNQRLEFFGDAVVQIIISEYLFIKYQNDDEGNLSKMRSSYVQRPMMPQFARELNLGDFILLGKGEDESGGRERVSTLGDAFEAVMGAVYIDGGLDAARNVLMPLVKNCGSKADELVIELNPKGMLQEFTQKHFKCAPTYTLDKVEGPHHAPTYTVSVAVNDTTLATGIGGKRKSAESIAAKDAYRVLMSQHNDNVVSNGEAVAEQLREGMTD